MMKNILIAVSGASGSIYAQTLIRLLGTVPNVRLSVILSDTARQIWKEELNEDFSASAYPACRVLSNRNFHVDVASGSSCPETMVILPASMGCIGRIAAGISSDLITRAADVMLKERRQLLIVPRESPLSSIHLRNLLTLSDAGAQIVPPIPAFYTHPASMEEWVAQFCNRLIVSMGIPAPSMDFKFLE